MAFGQVIKRGPLPSVSVDHTIGSNNISFPLDEFALTESQYFKPLLLILKQRIATCLEDYFEVAFRSKTNFLAVRPVNSVFLIDHFF